MKVRVFLLIFGMAANAQAKAFKYPSELGHPLGHAAVDQDLTKTYAKELEALGKTGYASEPSEHDLKISAEFSKKNRKLFAEIENVSVLDSAAPRLPAAGVTKAQAQAILEKIEKHPIVSEKNSLKYDTPSGQIGYCFGKAAYIHIELLRLGVSANSVAKIFAMGPLIHTGRGWDFHVATIVRASEGGWWVIVGLEKQVMTLADWEKEVLSWAQQPKTPLVRFYFSDATKLNPTPGSYAATTREPYYKGYFVDLGKWFAKNPPKAKENFSQN